MSSKDDSAVSEPPIADAGPGDASCLQGHEHRWVVAASGWIVLSLLLLILNLAVFVRDVLTVVAAAAQVHSAPHRCPSSVVLDRVAHAMTIKVEVDVDIDIFGATVWRKGKNREFIFNLSGLKAHEFSAIVDLDMLKSKNLCL